MSKNRQYYLNYLTGDAVSGLSDIERMFDYRAIIFLLYMCKADIDARFYGCCNRPDS